MSDTSAAGRTDRPGQGILLLLLGVLTLACMDGVSKALTERHHVASIAFGRAFFQMLLLLPVLLWRGPRVLRTAHPRLQVLRGAAIYACALLFVQALSVLAMADATAITFVAPLCVVVLSIVLLGERVDWQRWAAVGLGFLGVLVVVRPGSGVFGPAALWPLAEAVVWAFALSVTRRMRGDAALTTLAWSSLVQFVLACLVVPLAWRMPDARDIALAAATGLLSSAAQMLLILAFLRAPASLLAPFTYVQMLFAALIGWLAFGSFPDPWTWAGTAIIVAGGLLVWWRERVATG